MFNSIQNIEGYIEALKLEKVLHTHEPGYAGSELSPDDAYIFAWEQMAGMAHEMVELDWTSSVIFKFSFPEMHKFYDLCREHSRVNKINFKKNPYVTQAEEDVDHYFIDSDAQNFQWKVWAPRKLVNKKWDILLVETGCYFEDYIIMLDVLYEIQDYYKRKCKLIEQELRCKPKIIKLPKAKKETRKAA